MEAYLARFPDSPWASFIDSRLTSLKSVAAAPVAAPAAPAPVPAAPAEPEAGDRALALVAPSSDPTPPDPAPPASVIAPEADLSPRSLAALEAQISGSLVQFALKGLGFYDGAIDGKLGPASKQAIAAFQRSIGTPASGTLRPDETVALISAAAKAGNRDSQTIYGGMFATGAGVRQDLPRSVQWYRRAAEAGSGYGQLNLGYAYLNGWGVEKDPGQAREWLEAARGNGVPEAREALARLD
jgi:hypothetical protein